MDSDSFVCITDHYEERFANKQHDRTRLDRPGTHSSLGIEVWVPIIVAVQIVPKKRGGQEADLEDRSPEDGEDRCPAVNFPSTDIVEASSSRWLVTFKHTECDGCDD